MILLLLLLLLFLILFLIKCLTACKKELVMERNQTQRINVLNQNAYHIQAEYYNLQMECYLKQTYPNMVHWEYDNPNSDINHFCATENRVKIFTSSNQIMSPIISTHTILGIPIEEKTNIPDKIPVLSPEQQWLADHAGNIEAKVAAAMNSGRVSITYPLTDLADELKIGIPEILMQNTPYSAYLCDGKLTIDFQASIPLDLES